MQKRGKQPRERADAGRERRRRLAERGVPLDRGIGSGKKMTLTKELSEDDSDKRNEN